jgi:hypothetical protein
MNVVTAGILSALMAAERTKRKISQKPTVPTSLDGLAPGESFSTYSPVCPE